MNRREAISSMAIAPLFSVEEKPKTPDDTPFVYIRRNGKAQEMTLDKALVLVIEQRRKEQREKNG